MRNLSEKQLYPIVQRWLKRHFKCFMAVVNKGLRYSRSDVIGVRDVGGELSGEIETICVEVKKGSEPFATACGQAAGYRVYGNRVYLADKREETFDPDEIAIASNLGVGLIQIRKTRCMEVLSSPFYQPIARMNLMLMEKLRLGRCQICGCFFGIGDMDGGPHAHVSRKSIRNLAGGEKGLIFWNYAVGRRKLKLGHPGETTCSTYERRYICPDCLRTVFEPLVPPHES